jgi:hypothetical protein
VGEVLRNKSQTHRLLLLIKSSPHLAKDLAGLAEGSVGVGLLDLRSLLAAEQDVGRRSSLGLRLLSLGGLGIGFGGFGRHLVNYL